MLVVLELDDADVQAVVDAMSQLPRGPLRVSVMTEHTTDAAAVRGVLGWHGGLEEDAGWKMV